MWGFSMLPTRARRQLRRLAVRSVLPVQRRHDARLEARARGAAHPRHRRAARALEVAALSHDYTKMRSDGAHRAARRWLAGIHCALRRAQRDAAGARPDARVVTLGGGLGGLRTRRDGRRARACASDERPRGARSRRGACVCRPQRTRTPTIKASAASRRAIANWSSHVTMSAATGSRGAGAADSSAGAGSPLRTAAPFLPGCTTE